MKEENVAKLIKKMRESKKITQVELANILGISRNAIVRIEHGKRKIDVEELNKIESFFNISLKDYLKEDSKNTVKGIILAGGTGSRLYPITEGISKQLLPVYDKPMIFYPLSVLMQAGIQDILIITTPDDQVFFKKLLGDGKQFGINLSYTVQPRPDGLAQAFILAEDFIGNNPCAMILGDNIFYGSGLEKELSKAVKNAMDGYATIFGYQVKDPERFGIMEIDNYNNVLSIEEKPLKPKSDYAVTGLYFYPKGVSKVAKKIAPSLRGELEITNLNEIYLKKELLKATILDNGYTWFDTGTFESLLDAANMIKTIQNNKDIIICCPEYIGYMKGWLSDEDFSKRADTFNNNQYGKYLVKVKEKRRNYEKNRD